MPAAACFLDLMVEKQNRCCKLHYFFNKKIMFLFLERLWNKILYVLFFLVTLFYICNSIPNQNIRIW